MFLIEWRHLEKKKRKIVSRLNLRFTSDERGLFEQRVNRSKMLRNQAEDRVRHALAVELYSAQKIAQGLPGIETSLLGNQSASIVDLDLDEEEQLRKLNEQAGIDGQQVNDNELKRDYIGNTQQIQDQKQEKVKIKQNLNKRSQSPFRNTLSTFGDTIQTNEQEQENEQENEQEINSIQQQAEQTKEELQMINAELQRQQLPPASLSDQHILLMLLRSGIPMPYRFLGSLALNTLGGPDDADGAFAAYTLYKQNQSDMFDNKKSDNQFNQQKNEQDNKSGINDNNIKQNQKIGEEGSGSVQLNKKREIQDLKLLVPSTVTSLTKMKNQSDSQSQYAVGPSQSAESTLLAAMHPHLPGYAKSNYNPSLLAIPVFVINQLVSRSWWTNVCLAANYIGSEGSLKIPQPRFHLMSILRHIGAARKTEIYDKKTGLIIHPSTQENIFLITQASGFQGKKKISASDNQYKDNEEQDGDINNKINQSIFNKGINNKENQEQINETEEERRSRKRREKLEFAKRDRDRKQMEQKLTAVDEVLDELEIAIKREQLLEQLKNGKKPTIQEIEQQLGIKIQQDEKEQTQKSIATNINQNINNPENKENNEINHHRTVQKLINAIIPPIDYNSLPSYTTVLQPHWAHKKEIKSIGVHITADTYIPSEMFKEIGLTYTEKQLLSHIGKIIAEYQGEIRRHFDHVIRAQMHDAFQAVKQRRLDLMIQQQKSEIEYRRQRRIAMEIEVPSTKKKDEKKSEQEQIEQNEVKNDSLLENKIEQTTKEEEEEEIKQSETSKETTRPSTPSTPQINKDNSTPQIQQTLKSEYETPTMKSISSQSQIVTVSPPIQMTNKQSVQQQQEIVQTDDVLKQDIIQSANSTPIPTPTPNSQQFIQQNSTETKSFALRNLDEFTNRTLVPQPRPIWIKQGFIVDIHKRFKNSILTLQSQFHLADSRILRTAQQAWLNILTVQYRSLMFIPPPFDSLYDPEVGQPKTRIRTIGMLYDQDKK
ncbi:MAG: hypothetical protein EZS28_029431, partial [Streblomastix strix]